MTKEERIEIDRLLRECFALKREANTALIVANEKHNDLAMRLGQIMAYTLEKKEVRDGER